MDTDRAKGQEEESICLLSTHCFHGNKTMARADVKGWTKATLQIQSCADQHQKIRQQLVDLGADDFFDANEFTQDDLYEVSQDKNGGLSSRAIHDILTHQACAFFSTLKQDYFNHDEEAIQESF